ncbi:hypothetical protein MMAG44476_18207 [Mycolicibacterium mageritense DSM 44476 = CIP 104973]|uniref:3-keto-5-aminohexanoate cleavage protein n=1 Tax=Mycolicibacterium mageritense TaxID=53462 RepID=A0AAI8TQV0_MYCME|nr:3-keto-5-aminohexanoate cleavage protein [Mycolicibacterium mageritense]MCC9180188.1 3-keto-5-aminohexanoate cleavage protein [Mycolicibacterium mageritense]TXI64868.1 MAG: hypothetical protein E6Q55_04520 [Mycolicibacterium mageritense]CDO23717.1 3-keto-5-aminohexanoate cleavage enzyme [Mycolicibacterium mageritense DSM 44476 = CIP 104973]BBX31736.1 hypothetical protein MMAGJ_10180 [Mycolicibacterium mageritense]BDY26902.1 hypothetical protein hbim_00819 [Mycolicibacterium mageritense]
MAAIYLKACLNGARTPDEHPALPVTPEQLAEAAAAVHRVGARAVHLHPKTADGVDSLEPDIVGAAVSAVRHAVPGLPVGVTTGYWASPDREARLRTVGQWHVLPDFASVNWHEPGADELARALLDKGIGVEAGLFHAEAAAAWAASEVAEHCLRAMIELPPDSDVDTAAALLRIVTAADSPAPVLLHGEGESCWPLLEYAGALRLQARIGLEDTLFLPDGSRAPDNPTLVAAALDLLSQTSRQGQSPRSRNPAPPHN